AVGTTNVKGALITRDGAIHASCQVERDTLYDDDYVEQDTEQWRKAYIEIINTWHRVGVQFSYSVMISLCARMEGVSPIDRSRSAVRNAILYSDTRAEKQAARILE